ncbi:hypothetical protein ACHAWF_004640 [Thalassiosira exigua]
MAAPYPLRPGEADCRDFLRTGRCKYGESCKYNHPPNVESGGGMKPINPSEPLFPIRPNEPPCQYFLKHGTCKFGQSCKFNHPAGSRLGDGSGGLSMGQLVFVTANGVGPLAGEVNSPLMTASSAVQVLPQRPTEPNCIYFLRNGKCKYGATCKFHHPLDAMNRNQVQHIQAANARPSQNGRDRPQSAGSLSEGRPQTQHHGHNLAYAPASNVSYMQPPRLQPITERIRPQQPTHILLPDGQIAIILDPQSLQNVSELNLQDRPKFYLSQAEGSLKVPSNDPLVSSPMLTATTNSSSNQTFDSSLDLGGGSHHQGTPHRGPHKSGSGGSLSAYGSIDSGSHPPGDFAHPTQIHSQRMPNSVAQPSAPQYSAWPIHEVIDQTNQAHRRISPSNLESTDENAASFYWPSTGSFPSMSATECDVHNGRPYGSMPDSSPYGSNQAVSQAIHRSQSAEGRASVSPSASGEGRTSKSLDSTGDDCEGLTMMTSALLTMMDRQESPSGKNEAGATGRSPSRSPYPTGMRDANQGNVYVSQSEPNLHGKESPMRPPPGISSPPPGMSHVDSVFASNYNQDFERSRSPPGGGYFVGGYEQAPRSPPPPWDLDQRLRLD